MQSWSAKWKIPIAMGTKSLYNGDLSVLVVYVGFYVILEDL